MSDAPPRVAIRCDAGPEIGAGHVVRSLALAEGLVRCGARPVLITGPLAVVWRDMVAARDIALVEDASLAPGVAGVERLPEARADLLVLDGYGFDADHVRAWRERTGFVALVADHGPDHGADGVIDHNLSARPGRYPDAKIRLLGPGHALLREEFRAPPAPRTEHGVPTVLVTLGGSTTGSLLPLIVEGLEAAGRELVARIVAGPHDSHGSVPSGDRAARGKAAFVRVPPGPTLRPELEGASVAVLAAGGVRFEAARMGVPMLLGILADNQDEDARAFAAAGAARLLGRWSDLTAARLADAVRALLDDRAAREALSRRARALVDGHGAERAARALLTAATGRTT